MKKMLSTALAVGLGAGALAAPAALASTNPLAAVKTDLAKLQAAATARHDVLIADAGKLEADAKAATGGTRAQAKVTIKADVVKLRSDRASARMTLQADRAQLKADAKAVRQAGAGHGQLKALLKPARAQLKKERAEVHSEVRSARQAVKAMRASFKK